MSQLNNEEKIKKKFKTSTKIIIFLVIFTFVCIAITTALILYHKNNNTEIKQEEIIEPQTKEIYEVEDDEFGIKSLTERYNGNALNIEGVTDKIGTRNSTNQNINTSKIYIEYITIDGLKNKDIENKINQEIKNKVYGMYTESDITDEKIDSISIYTYANANFGNTLSVGIHKNVNYKEINNGKNYEYEVEYLNYDLTTGNKISFEELFTNKTSLRNVLIPAINKSLRNIYMNSIQEDNYGTIDFSKMDLSQIEEETYKILNRIVNDIDNVKFGFDCRNIYVSFDDQEIYIDMVNIYKNIAIYKRFLTNDSIFNNNYAESVKNAFVFSDTYLTDEASNRVYRILEDLEDNLRVETRVYCTLNVYNEKDGKKIYDDFVKTVTDKIQELKIEARKNPGKQILYVADYWIHGSEDSRLTDLGIKNIITNTGGVGRVYRMDKKYYDEVFYLKMAESQRDSYFGGSDIIIYEIGESEKDVEFEDINQENESFDLFTNKTANQLEGIYYITDYVNKLKKCRDNVKNGENIMQYDNYLFQIEYYKDFYKLDGDEEVKELEEEAKKIVDEMDEIVEKRRKKQEEEEMKENKQEETKNNIINEIQTNQTNSNDIEQKNNTLNSNTQTNIINSNNIEQKNNTVDIDNTLQNHINQEQNENLMINNNI